ncbi:YjdF family protein [Bacillus sonorensis]|uniref:YjdF family protein n=1 Tax=Bacillus sonorensis TaxID=119858 RepID=UPI00227DAEEC|nr:YjdF family protein [Bacillus sonorensis]MCZ0067247.1 YjdF family protein [Bacillus sonorensis]MCZ0095777.1 YjdF family protein [Bacillus sonorensis]MEC1517032.1 YjdF family protein [Bacillus sonorensis]
MKLTIYYDGQFWIGIIEIVQEGNVKAFRHLFGREPKDVEILNFVHHQLLQVISQTEQEGIGIKAEAKKKINPKRLQRQVAKEMKSTGVSTKAQQAIKQGLEAKKAMNKRLNKEQREKEKEQKYRLGKQKAKEKHRGK